MAKQVTKWESNTGKLFDSENEALSDDAAGKVKEQITILEKLSKDIYMDRDSMQILRNQIGYIFDAIDELTGLLPPLDTSDDLPF